MLPIFPSTTTYNDLLSYFVETKYEPDSQEQTLKTIKATFKKLTGYSINAKVEDTDLQLVIDTLSNAKIPHCTFADWLCKFDIAEDAADGLEAASYDVVKADAAAKTELLEIVLENMVAPEAEKIEQLEALVTKRQEALRNLETVEQYARIWRRTILNLDEEIAKYKPISPPTVAGLYQMQPKNLAEMVRNGVTWEGLLPQISVSPYRMLILCGDLFRSGSLSVVSVSDLALLISKIDEQLVDYAANGVLHQALKELYRELTGKQWADDFRGGRSH
jgi:hypothetical protein